MLRARSTCNNRLIKTAYSHRFHKPSVLSRAFKTGPDLINDFEAGKERLVAKPFKPLKIRCNFNNWLEAELKQFKLVDDVWFGSIFAWSAMCFYVASILMPFAYLVWLIGKVENQYISQDNLAMYRTEQNAEKPKSFYAKRDLLEIECFTDILATREDLTEAYKWYKWWVSGIVSATFGYYLAMGRKLGMDSLENWKLSLKRLFRRRGFAWNTVLVGYFCLNMSSLNYYYSSYILGPKYRALSLTPDDYAGLKRKFMSAYGGKGLALQRVYASSKVTNPRVLELAHKVAFHEKEHVIDETGELKLTRSHVFQWNWGFQYRSPKACDCMPGQCWFKSPAETEMYIKALNKFARKKQKIEPTKEKKQTEKVKKQEETKEDKNNKSEEGEEKARLAVGMAFGATDDWEMRFLKASHTELAKATLERLEVLQLLSKINRISRDENIWDSCAKYLQSLRPFARALPKLTGVKYYVDGNREKHCLCHYYPYYIGAFPQ